MLCFPSDASLTPSSLLAALGSVENVDTLEDVLGVPQSKRYELRMQSGSIEERRELVIRYFLQTSPYATWEGIGSRLLYREQYTALDEVKGYMKPHEGEYVVTSDLHGLCPCT